MATSGYPKSQVAWYALLVFFLAALLSYTDRSILNLFVDPIRHDLALSDTQLSYLQGAAFAIIYAIMALPFGCYADRHKRRNLFACGIALWSLATAMCGLSGSFTQMFLARMFVGIGEATLPPTVMSMIPDFFPPARRGTAYGIFLTGMVMGSGAASIFGGALFHMFASGALAGIPILGPLAPWRSALISLSCPGAIIALLLMTIPEPPRQESLVGTPAATRSEQYRRLLRYFIENRATFTLLLAAFTLDNIRQYGTDSWMPSLLMRRFSLTPSGAGTLLGYTLLISAGCGSVIGGVASDWYGHKGHTDGTLRIALLAIVGELVLSGFPLFPTVLETTAGYGVFTLLTSLVTTAGITATQSAVPGEMRGVAVAIQASLYTLVGLGIGPTLVAVITDSLYRDPRLVGPSIFTVSLPMLLVIAVLLRQSLPYYRHTHEQLVQAVIPRA